MKTYRMIRAAYLERQSIRHAAKVAGVQVETARRYIIEGRPDSNMPSIANFAKAQAQKEQAELELDLRAFRLQYMKELREAMGGSLIELRLHNAKTKRLAELAAKEAQKKDGQVVEPSAKKIEEVKAYEIMVKLMERALGAADETVQVGKSDFTEQMTAEECAAFLLNAEIPERLR